jgi:hypothetical protein
MAVGDSGCEWFVAKDVLQSNSTPIHRGILIFSFLIDMSVDFIL